MIGKGLPIFQNHLKIYNMKCFFTLGKHLRMLMLLLCLLCSCILMAQKRVTGKVIEKKNNTAMNGVSVLEKGSKNGTTTAADGSFSITVTSAKPVLVITMVGYAPQEISVGNKTSLDVSMEEKDNSMED